MYNLANSSPTVTNCTFSGNTAVNYGGGMYNDNSSPTLTNCTFSNNSATYGGGMYNLTNSSPTVTNCTFSGNTAVGHGGGMRNYTSSSPTVTNCTFSGNEAGIHGGGMANYESSPTVTNCTFSNNSATYGGGMYNYTSSPTVTNCTFSGNSADYGGGMGNWDMSSPTVTNCTFSGNTAVSGGGMGNYDNSNPTVINCILWGDTPDEIYDDLTSSTFINYSNVQDGWPGPPPPPGNIDADPWFVDAAGGDLRLSSSASPCVDAGNNSASGLPATDLAGNPRIVDGDRNGTATVDMGAYEFQSWLIHNITRGRWYEIIQRAIDDANDYDEIEVAPGTYYEAINFNGTAVRLYSSGGPEVTTIDANGLNSSVVTCKMGEDANTILEGFTITGGSGTTVGGYKYGGGMYNYSSSPTVTDCNFTTNSATGDGGGMYNNQWSSPTVTNCSFAGNSAAYAGGGMDNRNDSSPTLADCTFSGNTAGTSGGGMENVSSSPTVTDCNFTGNTANHAGGMHNYNSSPAVTNCTFSNNTAFVDGGGMLNNGSSPTVSNSNFRDNTAGITDRYGGGMHNFQSIPMVTNCTFSGNTAAYGGGMSNYESNNPTVANCAFTGNTASSYGGGIYNYISSPRVTNCTFTDNSANYGGGMYNANGSNPNVTNCILWGDSPDEIDNNVSTPTVTYCDVDGGWPGLGNIDTDPCFVDANNPDPNLWNLRLNPDSPCIDAGNTTAVPLGISLGLDGNPRGVDDPASPDTGVSFLGVTVDMGVYEFQPCPIAGDVNCDGVVDFKDLAILAGNWLAGVGD